MARAHFNTFTMILTQSQLCDIVLSLQLDGKLISKAACWFIEIILKEPDNVLHIYTYFLISFDSQRAVVGDASETALLKFSEVVLGDVMDIRKRNHKVAEIPFNSTNKFQVSCSSQENLCYYENSISTCKYS